MRASRIARFLWVAALAVSCSAPKETDPLVVDDVSRLNATRVAELTRPERIEELRSLLARAAAESLKVSIGGTRHSQGGHIVSDGALFIDMRGFDHVLDVDTDAMTVTVEAGATWDDVQRAVHPYGLAVAVMQSSNIFSVGGTLSCNAHGRDPRFGPVSQTVRSFRLMLADGRIVVVDRESEPELFSAALGGYGLFGIILDVELRLTRDVIYEREVRVMHYTEYPGYFMDEVRGHADVGLHSGRLSIVPGEGFLTDAYVRTYREVAGEPEAELREESNVARDRFFFGLSRGSDWGKRLRWRLQQALGDKAGEVERISRNNAMRPPIEFLQYESDGDTDILQEYFVPADAFVPFVDGMRDILREDEVNLLHLTIRYVPESHDVLLSYSTTAMFAFVMYMNIGLSDEALDRARNWTRRLVDLALEQGGTYYLVYQRFPTVDQMRRAYPGWADLAAAKGRFDPGGRFSNGFYETYFPARSGASESVESH